MATPVRRHRGKRGLEEPETPVKCQKPRLMTPETPEKCQKARATQGELLLDQGRGTYPLVAREKECDVLDSFFKACFEGTSGSLYLSGGPGTGKTSVARAAARVYRHDAKTRVVEVNCMELQASSVVGFYLRLIEVCEAAGATSSGLVSAKSPLSSLMTAAAAALRQLGSSVILIIDEVDQLVLKPSPENSLDHLCSLAGHSQAPGLAIVMIANAVDLLVRASKGQSGCASLLFEPYTTQQLRSIVKSHFACAPDGQQAENALGRSLELSIRRVAAHSGDCRHIVRLCDDGFAAARQKEALGRGEAPPKLAQAENDPLAEVKHFALGHQILLGTLSQSERQDVDYLELFARYKAMMSKLKQPAISKPQVNSILSALEQRGLLHLRKKKVKGRGNPELIIELVVSRKSLKDVLCEAGSLLQHCFS